MKKNYTALAVAAASVLGLTLATSAFAQTTAPQRMGAHMRVAMKPGVAGKVTAVNGTSITISGRATGATRPMPVIGTSNTGTKPTPPALVTYTVDASAATVTKGATVSTVSSIAVGDQVFVEGTVNGTNVTATAVRDGLMMRTGKGNGNGPATGIQGNGEPVVAGAVTSVNGSTFVLTNSGNATYTVDASGATVRKGNATSTVAAILSGDMVIVQGPVNGTSVAATSVFDQGVKPAAGSNGNPPKAGFMGSIGSFFKKLFGF